MFAGEFIYGDAGTLLRIRHRKRDGSAYDQSGVTEPKLICRAADGSVVTIVAVISSPASAGEWTVAGLGTAFNPGTERQVLVECSGSWKLNGQLTKSHNTFTYAIVKFP